MPPSRLEVTDSNWLYVELGDGDRNHTCHLGNPCAPGLNAAHRKLYDGTLTDREGRFQLSKIVESYIYLMTDEILTTEEAVARVRAIRRWAKNQPIEEED